MRVLRTWGLGVGATIALCVSTTTAVGQAPPLPVYPECTKKPNDSDVEGAKGAHKAASQFYDRAEYEKAIRYWNDAYTFDCTANDLLVNLANAYERLGDRPSTIVSLETYLKRTGPNATMEQKVANLKKLMGPAPKPPPVAPTAAASPASTSVPPSPPAPLGTRPYGNLPWYFLGGGGAAAVAGMILMPLGYRTIGNVEKTCPQRKDCTAEEVSQGNTGRTEAGLGWALLTMGVLSAGGGLAWQVLFNKPQGAPSKQGFWMAPLAAPAGGGVSFGGLF